MRCSQLVLIWTSPMMAVKRLARCWLVVVGSKFEIQIMKN